MPDQSDPVVPSWLTVSTDPPARDSAVLAGAGSRTRAALFTEWAARLDFPDYFGRNWDAFEECLTDLVAERPRTLLVTDAAELLADEPPEQLGILLGVLDTIAAGAADPTAGPALRVLLHPGPADPDALRRRIGAALA
ncbi:barstar family protein [Micromonosporaceae bacterium B7E4]